MQSYAELNARKTIANPANLLAAMNKIKVNENLPPCL